MKRTIISTAIFALVAGGAGVAAAGPYPNGNNNYGLCTAYKAQEDNRPGGANDTFKAMAEEYDSKNGGSGKFAEMCEEVLAGGPGNSNGKGGGR